MNRNIPDENPVGWDFSAFPEGWLGPELVEGYSDGWTGDVADDDDAMHDHPGVLREPIRRPVDYKLVLLLLPVVTMIRVTPSLPLR